MNPVIKPLLCGVIGLMALTSLLIGQTLSQAANYTRVIPPNYEKDQLHSCNDRLLVKINDVWHPWNTTLKKPDMDRGIPANLLGEGSSFIITDATDSYAILLGRTADEKLLHYIAGWDAQLLCKEHFINAHAINDQEIYVLAYGYEAFIAPDGTLRSPRYQALRHGNTATMPFTLDGDSWGLMNDRREVTLPPSKAFADIRHFSDCGLACFKSPEGLYGYLNQQGRIVIPAQYEVANNFSEDIASVALKREKDKNNQFFIDVTGTPLFPQHRFAYSIGFKNGLAVIVKRSGFTPEGSEHERFFNTAQLINRNGRILSQGRFSRIENPSSIVFWKNTALRAKQVTQTRLIGGQHVPSETKDLWIDYQGKVWPADAADIPPPPQFDSHFFPMLFVRDGVTASAGGQPLQGLFRHLSNGEIVQVLPPRFQALDKLGDSHFRFQENGHWGVLKVTPPPAPPIHIHDALPRLPLGALDAPDFKDPSYELLIPPQAGVNFIATAEESPYIALRNETSWSLYHRDGRQHIPFGRIPALEPGYYGSHPPVFSNPDYGYTYKLEGDDFQRIIINARGERLIERSFKAVKDLGQGRLQVEEWNATHRVVDLAGHPLTPDYQFLGPFNNQRAIFSPDGKRFGILDDQLQVVLPPTYPAIQSFSDGLARFQDDQGLFGYLASDGSVALPPRYLEAGNFYHGIAQVSDRGNRYGKYYFIDPEGRTCFNGLRVHTPSDFREGVATISVQTGTAMSSVSEEPHIAYGMIDTQGETLVPCVLESLAAQKGYLQADPYNPIRSGTLPPDFGFNAETFDNCVCVTRQGTVWKGEFTGAVVMADVRPELAPGDPFYHGLKRNHGFDTSHNYRHGISYFPPDGPEQVLVQPQFRHALLRLDQDLFSFKLDDGRQGVIRVRDPRQLPPATEPSNLLSEEEFQQSIGEKTQKIIDSIDPSLPPPAKALQLHQRVLEQLQSYRTRGQIQNLYLALNLCGHALRLNDQVPTCWTTLGDIHSEMARFQVLRADEYAMDAYRQALALDPEDATTHLQLGIKLAGTGAYKQALDHFESAVSRQPVLLNKSTLEWLSLCYLEGAQTLRGIQFTDTLLKSDPERADIRYVRILLHLAHFDRVGAEHELKLLLATPGLPDELAQRARNLIANHAQP